MRVRRQQNLAPVTSGEQSAGPVENRPEVVAAAGLHFADVHRHADAKWARLAPMHVREGTLSLAGGGDGSPDVGESEVHAVADSLDDSSAGRLDGAHDDAIVLGHGRS